MAEIPQFFVPAAESPEQAERVYAEFARMSRQNVPPMAQRIYSITHKSNGEKWTATVGEQLRGIKYRVTGKGANKRETEVPASDPATVLAIFPGVPYFVITNQAVVNVGSQWEGVFMAGSPYNIILFASQED